MHNNEGNTHHFVKTQFYNFENIKCHLKLIA